MEGFSFIKSEYNIKQARKAIGQLRTEVKTGKMTFSQFSILREKIEKEIDKYFELQLEKVGF